MGVTSKLIGLLMHLSIVNFRNTIVRFYLYTFKESKLKSKRSLLQLSFALKQALSFPILTDFSQMIHWWVLCYSNSIYIDSFNVIFVLIPQFQSWKSGNWSLKWIHVAACLMLPLTSCRHIEHNIILCRNQNCTDQMYMFKVIRPNK